MSRPIKHIANERTDDELAGLFLESLDMLCVAGRDGYFTRLNPAWSTRLGWTLEQLQSKPLLDFVHPEDREVTRSEIEMLGRGKSAALFVNRCRRQDGTYLSLRWTARPARGRARIFAVVRDLSRQLRLEREVLEIADQEKERLGRELHDDLCQKLAGIAAMSAGLSRSLETSSQLDASARAAEIAVLLNETNLEVRRMAHGLNAQMVNGRSLDQALDGLARDFRRMFTVSCALQCERPFPELEHDAELQLFRIAQEAVNNAVLHGRAKKIGLSLKSKEGAGLLQVRDDGVGIPAERDMRGGIGIRTMAYRARLIGGNFDVSRLDPNGTVVSCAFPLPVPGRGEQKSQTLARCPQ